MSFLVQRLAVSLEAEPRRVLLRPYATSSPVQAEHVIGRVLALPEEEVPGLLASVLAEFEQRHWNLRPRLLRHFEAISGRLPDESLTQERRLLLGACFSAEYALEAAALFNPSIVPHPDQTGVPAGALRFVLSLRSTGEGHISCITFRAGLVDSDGHVQIEPGSTLATEPSVIHLEGQEYEAFFESDSQLSERVLFPVTEAQSNGIEDARFVRLGESYYGTYTAYDGRQILPQLIQTQDFQRFRFITPTGEAVRNKGFALFPRMLNDQYAMLGRQDGENLTLMLSDNLRHWPESRVIAQPRFPWELVQIGNCGSPLETESGWLVLTHGVGPLRKYCIGALLLDRDQPDRVVGRLSQPLLAPLESEREGYVPNVVYSCGGLLHAGWLMLPYAVSDSACRFARIQLKALLEAMS